VAKWFGASSVLKSGDRRFKSHYDHLVGVVSSHITSIILVNRHLTLALQLEQLFMFQKFKQTMVNLIFDTMDLYYGMKLMRDLKF